MTDIFRRNHWPHLIFTFFLLGSSASMWSQDIKMANPSFEDDPAIGIPPKDWFKCGSVSTPDILPGPFEVDTPPYEGNSYVGIVARSDETLETMGQELLQPLQEDQCYSFDIHLAYFQLYPNYEPIQLRIWGGRVKCEKEELLWESGEVQSTDWHKFTAYLHPAEDYLYLFFEAYYAKKEPYTGYILIDALSDIRQEESDDFLPADTVMCAGDSLVLDAGEIDLPIIWNNESTSAQYVIKKAGTYSFSINALQCTYPNSDTIVVSTLDRPISLLQEDTVICDQLPIDLDVSTVSAQSYEWNTGAQQASLKVEHGGLYWVDIANDLCSVRDSILIEETTCIPCDLFAPNVFSPNNDGIHDVFVPQLTCDFFDFKMKIVDRWGHTVFQTNDLQEYWDGTIQGQEAASGTYSYSINYSFTFFGNIQRQSYSGILTLLR